MRRGYSVTTMCRCRRRQLLISAELHHQGSERNWSCTNQRKGLWPHPFVEQMLHGEQDSEETNLENSYEIWQSWGHEGFHVGLIIDHVERLSNTNGIMAWYSIMGCSTKLRRKEHKAIGWAHRKRSACVKAWSCSDDDPWWEELTVFFCSGSD